MLEIKYFVIRFKGDDMNNLNRRNLLVKSLIGAGALAAAPKTVKAALESCGLTPAQTEGPFYPIQDQADKDNDLTRVKGRTRSARGKVVILKGIVQDDQCRPVPNALVEIWQACASGKYNHPGDPNTAELDPDFQYWGRAVTNAKGEYEFKTIRPGHYPATNTWMRPAHIHMKVHRRGFEELTTQVYFKDDPYNRGDRILQALSPAEKSNVIVDFKKQPHQADTGVFNITVTSIV
jgi:protocatechuate 3,4-dioxygenase beta subunit